MSYKYKISDTEMKKVIKLAKSTVLSPLEIQNKLSLPISVRQIQRILVKHGLNRDKLKAYKTAVRKGRVGAHKKKSTIKRMELPAMLRYMIMQRDNFKCVLCGADAKTRLLEIDHMDFNVRNNDPKNLRVLCEWCNFGRRKNIAMS